MPQRNGWPYCPRQRYTRVPGYARVPGYRVGINHRPYVRVLGYARVPGYRAGINHRPYTRVPGYARVPGRLILHGEFLMRLFANTVDASIARLACCNTLREIDLPSELRHAERTKNGDILRLDLRCVAMGDWGEVRGVYIVSAKIEVVSLFFFPNPACALPVYAMEFVVISQRPLVGVIDMLCLDNHPMLRAQVSTLLRQAHRDFPFTPAEDPPTWYEECRSGLDFFVRPPDLQTLQNLHSAHTQLWAHFMQFFIATPATATDAIAHHNALQVYKRHHCDNSPGVPLLQQSFGKAWTQRFLHDGLFA